MKIRAERQKWQEGGIEIYSLFIECKKDSDWKKSLIFKAMKTKDADIVYDKIRRGNDNEPKEWWKWIAT